MSRYEHYRRSGLNKSSVRKVRLKLSPLKAKGELMRLFEERRIARESSFGSISLAFNPDRSERIRESLCW